MTSLPLLFDGTGPMSDEDSKKLPVPQRAFNIATDPSSPYYGLPKHWEDAWNVAPTTVPVPPGSKEGYGRFIKTGHLPPFPQQHLFIIDCSHIPPSFFSTNQPGVLPHYEKMILSSNIKNKTKFNDHAMFYEQLGGGKWPVSDNKFFSHFEYTLEACLELYGNRPTLSGGGPPSRDEGRASLARKPLHNAYPVKFTDQAVLLGFMATRWQKPQIHHTNSKRTDIERYMNFCENDKHLASHGAVHKWHALAAFTPGGRIVYFNGVPGHSTFQKDPVRAAIPTQAVVCWRCGHYVTLPRDPHSMSSLFVPCFWQ